MSQQKPKAGIGSKRAAAKAGPSKVPASSAKQRKQMAHNAPVRRAASKARG